MFRSSKATLVLATALLLASGGALAASGGGRAEGDLPFQLSFYSFPAGGDSTRLVALGTLPTDFIAWKTADSLRAELDLSWKFHSSGRVHASSGEKLRLVRPLGEARRGAQAMITGTWTLPPGIYRAEFRVRDRGGRKGWRLWGGQREGAWSGRVEARDFSEGGRLSDALLYSVGADSLSSANPWASFEQGSPFMEVYAELSSLPGQAERWLSLQLEILDAEGAVMLERKGGWRVDRDRYPLRLRLPLAGLTPGDYRLMLHPAGPGVADEIVELPFRVLPLSLRSPAGQRRQEIEARLLLDEDGFRDWTLQTAAQRSETLRRFWAERDPHPGQPGNALKEEFQRRYNQAQSRFSGFRPGPLTDMGRLWIRLGEPDEVRVDVLPENDEALASAVTDMHGLRQGGAPNFELQQDLSRIGLGGLGSPGSESEAFEVWVYRLGGHPLLPEHRLELQNIDLTVIFLDRSGCGEYALEFSSEEFDF